MSYKTRKRIWPVALMSLAVFGVLAAVVALSVMTPQPSQAHGCDDITDPIEQAECVTDHVAEGVDDASQAHEHNAAPTAVGSIDAVMLTAGMTSDEMDVSGYFSDADGDDLTYTAASSDEAVATAQLAEPTGDGTTPVPPGTTASMLTITGVAAGSATITVTAADPDGAMDTQTVAVTVTAHMDTDTVSVSGWSSTGGGSDDVVIQVTGQTLDIDDSIILVLDDKFSVPSSVPSGSVFIREPGGSSGGARVTASVSVDSEDDDLTGDDSHTIRVYVPDMNPADNMVAGITRDFAVVIAKAAGVKNPTEGEKTYAIGYQILRGTAGYTSGGTMEFDSNGSGDPMDSMVHVRAKVSLDDENNKRGYELTITGTGFNSGSSATAYVAHASAIAAYWNGLDCDAMNALVGSSDTMGMGYCRMWAPLSESQKANVAGEAIGQNRGSVRESIGSGTVGSDHKVVVTTEVTGGSKGDFVPGDNNYIAILDDNAPTRRYSTSAKLFELQHSIAVEPSDVASGEEVTVKLRDYEGTYMVTNVSLDGKRSSANGDFDINVNSSGTELTFLMPGGVSGTVEVAVETDGPSDKDATITVNPSSLDLSQTEVAPNASIIISGSGFNEGKMIAVEDITIDDERLVVDDAGTVACAASISASGECVQVTSSGEFTATVRVWTHSSSNANPALDDDDFTIKVKDQDGFEGKATVTIKSATVKVTPETASPRDFIVISGENWPISTAELDNSVTIEIDGRSRQADVDSTGRFRYEYQLRANIGIGDEHDVKVTYADGTRDDIEEETTFSVVEADISVNPAAAAPGQTISVSIGGMRPYTLIDEIRIGRVSLLGNQSVTTDREGDATVSNITVPYLDPGHYPVTVQVGSDTRVVEFEMLAEAAVTGVAVELPDAVSDLGDNLDAIFHFNNTSKEWTFYDPRPEFAELNTLNELNGGQPYWVLVKDSQEDVDWNGRLVSFTCAGGDCWNLEIW